MSETLTITTTLTATNNFIPSLTLTNTITLDGGAKEDKLIEVASGGSTPSWITELAYDRDDSNLPSLNGADFAFMLIQLVSGEDAVGMNAVEIQANDSTDNDNHFAFELRPGEWLLLQRPTCRLGTAGNEYGADNGGVFLDSGGAAVVAEEITKIYLQNKSSGTAAVWRVIAAE